MAVDVPSFIRSNAQRGLDYNREGKGGDGLTDKTLAEARELADGSTTESKVRRMVAWFARHQPDLDAPKNKPGNPDFPGAGAVAWLIWGGSVSGDVMDAAKWAERLVQKWDKEAQAFDSGRTDKMANEILTIEDQLAASKAILGAVQAEKAELQGAFETLAAEKLAALAEVTKVAESSKVTIEALEQKLAGFEAEKAELQKQLAEALANQVTASKEAAKIAASVGISPVAVSPGDELAAADAKPDADAIRKTFLGMKPGAERQAFFRKHLSVLTATK